jgi:hypothetical protein
MRTPTIGVPYTLLPRVGAVIGAFEEDANCYSIHELPAKVFRRLATPQPSGTNGQVHKAVFLKEGTRIGGFSADVVPAWIFQANPGNFPGDRPLEAYLREASEGGKPVSWYVGQPGLARKMRVGQRVYIWRAAGPQKSQPGLIASGLIQEVPRVRSPFAWERKYEAHRTGASTVVRAVLKVDGVFSGAAHTMSKESLSKDAVLGKLHVILTPRPTVFELDELESARIEELLKRAPMASTVFEALGQEEPTRVSRLVRIAYNTSPWRRPTGEAAKLEGPESFNRINGFGHEDWFFREEWLLAGWRYAFLQAFNSLPKAYAKKPLDVTLFTIEPDGRRRLIAKISDLELLTPQHATDAVAAFKRNRWFRRMEEEIDDVDGKKEVLTSSTWAPNILDVRYRPENIEWFPPNTYIKAKAWIERRARYKPYAFDPEEIGVPGALVFGKGGRRKKGSLGPIRRRGSESITFDPLHERMAQKLEAELCAKYGRRNVEREAHHVDVTVRKGRDLILYEIKTSQDARLVVREALGQILEYAHFHPGRETVTELVIVGRAKPTAEVEGYLAMIRANLRLPLTYHVLEP